MQGKSIVVPIPIDEVVEFQCKLTIGFDNLRERLGVDDVLGATYMERREMLIDESLDPADHPEREGRYHFTLAHETGHWQLHRRYFVKDPRQGLLFAATDDDESVVCRTSGSKEPMEWQADYFGACLLMPRHLLIERWKEKVGPHPWQFDEDAYQGIFPVHLARECALGALIEVFAADFRVSLQAMRIRLNEFNLLPKEDGLQLFR